MKRARPDVFHARIVLASCRALPDGDGDDTGLVAALRRRGLHARWLPWDDPGTESADLVILRGSWDYAERLEEFLDWTRRVRNLLNAPDVVAWNSNKRYLSDLAGAGVPVLPSTFVAAGGGTRPDPALFAGEVVVKPAVGAGSLGARRFVEADQAAAHAAALLDAGRDVLVQPYDARVTDGETALVFIGGEQSHAFTKPPMLPPAGREPELDDSGTFAREALSPAEPDFELWDLGHAALDAAARHLNLPRSEFLYARVDLIGGPGAAVVLELELIEPGLGWRQLGEEDRRRAQRGFAIAVESALERLGLGPLSRRRP